MATALDVLPLARMKRELAIPETVMDHDVLVLEQIRSSVSFASLLSGLDIEDMTVDEVPQAYVAACIGLTRSLYDGIQNWSVAASFYHLLAPLRVLSIGFGGDDEDDE